MPSGDVSVHARSASDPLDAVAQARDKRRHSTESSSVASPSRQLDFRGERRDDDETEDDSHHKTKKKQRQSGVAARERIRGVIADEEDDAEPEQEPRTPPRKKKRANSDSDEPRTADTRSPGTPLQRRRVRMWTKEEEDALIAGVRKHGMGAWRTILEEGEDVFHAHRTNVDLKDKWKNLVQREAKFPARERRSREARRTAARLSFSSLGLADDDNASVASSHNSTVYVDERPTETDFSHGGNVELLICSDDIAPHMRSLSISLQRCATISALKRQLTRRLLDDSPLPTNLQLVSIKTRRLLADLEALEDCIARDGREFFLLYDP